MTGFEKMCSVCKLKNVCDKKSIEECVLTKYANTVIIDRLKREIEEDPYPLCNRCIHYHNCCSSLFGDCWTCSVNSPNCSEVCDNDWYKDTGEPLHECSDYVFGIPYNYCVG